MDMLLVRLCRWLFVSRRKAPTPLDGIAGDQCRTWQVVEQRMKESLAGDMVGKDFGHAGPKAGSDRQTQQFGQRGSKGSDSMAISSRVGRDLCPDALIGLPRCAA